MTALAKGMACLIALPNSTSETCSREAVMELRRVRPCGHTHGDLVVCVGHARTLIGTTMPLPSWCSVQSCGARGHIRMVPDGPIPTAGLHMLWWWRRALRYPIRKEPR